MRRRRWRRGRRRSRFSVRLWALAAAPLALLLAVMAFAYANTITGVNPPPLGASQSTVTANALKPAACSSINVTNVTTGGGGGAGDLMLLSGGFWFTGGNGDDCIVIAPGSGIWIVQGGNGHDICIGSGNAWVVNCEEEYP
jgi:hypothetical protein